MSTNNETNGDADREQLVMTALERLVKLRSKRPTGLTKRISLGARLYLDQFLAIGKMVGLHDPMDLVNNCIVMALRGAQHHGERGPGPELLMLATTLAAHSDEAVAFVNEWVHEMTGGRYAS